MPWIITPHCLTQYTTHTQQIFVVPIDVRDWIYTTLLRHRLHMDVLSNIPAGHVHDVCHQDYLNNKIKTTLYHATHNADELHWHNWRFVIVTLWAWVWICTVILTSEICVVCWLAADLLLCNTTMWLVHINNVVPGGRSTRVRVATNVFGRRMQIFKTLNRITEALTGVPCYCVRDTEIRHNRSFLCGHVHRGIKPSLQPAIVDQRPNAHLANIQIWDRVHCTHTDKKQDFESHGRRTYHLIQSAHLIMCKHEVWGKWARWQEMRGFKEQRVYAVFNQKLLTRWYIIDQQWWPRNKHPHNGKHPC